MCDGVTQGEDGMDLSLFSRDTIAMSTAIALSHNLFDAVICLGICDKIVPGLMIGALSFGHLPTLFIPPDRCRQDCRIRKKPRCGKRSQRARLAGRTSLLRNQRPIMPRNLYLLWYRQQQSDADGVHGSAVTGWVFR